MGFFLGDVVVQPDGTKIIVGGLPGGGESLDIDSKLKRATPKELLQYPATLQKYEVDYLKMLLEEDR